MKIDVIKIEIEIKWKKMNEKKKDEKNVKKMNLRRMIVKRIVMIKKGVVRGRRKSVIKDYEVSEEMVSIK
uniref:hypothetical protein n=1 Tax=Staphylococcus epidermidis TaxID=1282 RepID=UPI001C931016